MKGVIIAGGLGTRLRPLTYLRPKPLTPVANRPFLEYQVALLKKYGVEDIVFATNYMAERIEEHFGDGNRFGVRMQYALEDSPLGTGGAIRNAAELFPGETIAVFNGDVLTDMDLGAVFDYHRRKRAIGTITLAEVARPNPFGVLELDANGKVAAWNEPSEEAKKQLVEGKVQVASGTDYINAGFYVLEPELLSMMEPGRPYSVERDIYPRLIQDGAPLFGMAPGGFWMDVGRPEQLLMATQALLSGDCAAHTPPVRIAPGCDVAPDARIDALSAVGSGCRIGAGARLERTILMDRVSLGERTWLSGVIVDQASRLEEDVRVEARDGGPSPIIAAGSTLARGSRLT